MHKLLQPRWCRLVLAVFWVGLALLTHWPSLSLPMPEINPIIQHDKIAHFSFFAVLTLLLILARPAGVQRSWQVNALVAALIAAVYAPIDEYTQRYFNRTSHMPDLIANWLGIMTVYLIAAQNNRTMRLPTWVVYFCRTTWIIVAPTLVLLALLPQSTWIIRELGQWTGQSIRTDHLLHLWIALLLTWLLAGAAPLGRRRPQLSCAMTIALMLLAGPTLEILQGYTGRSVQVEDVWQHMKGVAWALLGWCVWTALRTVSDPAASPTAEATITRPISHATPEDEGSFVGHALVVSLLTLISRLTGLVRDAVLAAVFGLSAVADAFFIGFLVPNLFRRLFGEGALSAAFIPHYASLIKNDPLAARRFATLCITLLAVVLAVLTIVGELLLWWMLHAGQWSGKSQLAIHYTMLMLPYMPLICLVALFGGMLQVHGRFGPPAATPILLNLTIVGFAVGASVVYGQSHIEAIARAVALGVVAAGIVQLIWQFTSLMSCTRLSLGFADTGPTLRAMLTMMLPMVLGLAVFQINTLFDSLLAFFLSPPDGQTDARLNLFGYVTDYPIQTGGVAALNWAQRLYQFPHGVFGIAIATAIFPALARAGADDSSQGSTQFRAILQQGLRLSMYIGLPASVGMVMIRLPLTRLVYERAEFSLDDAQRVATILAFYALSIWAYAMMQLLTRAFYAKKDARTPLRISMIMVLINLLMNLVLIWPLGVAGLACSTAITAVVQVLVLMRALRRYVDNPIDAAVWRSWLKVLLLSGVMAAVLGAMTWWLDPIELPRYEAYGLLLAMLIVGGALVIAGSYLLRCRELHWLIRRKVE